MPRTLSELAVMQSKMEAILNRTRVSVDQYKGGEVTEQHKRFYMYELQLDVVIGSIRVLGHMMEEYPHDLDGSTEKVQP